MAEATSKARERGAIGAPESKEVRELGYRPDGSDPGDTPEAGDVDPAATASADETGQSGDTTEPKKRHGLPWS